MTQLNILSQGDAARLLRWAMLWANAHPQDGPEIRRLVVLMKDMLSGEDLLMLAKLAEDGGQPALSDLLRDTAGTFQHED